MSSRSHFFFFFRKVKHTLFLLVQLSKEILFMTEGLLFYKRTHFNMDIHFTCWTQTVDFVPPSLTLRSPLERRNHYSDRSRSQCTDGVEIRVEINLKAKNEAVR